MVLTNQQKQKIEEIGQKHDLRFIILHGSQAVEKAHERSDVDIALLGKDRLLFPEVLELHGEFSGIFGDNQKRELDIKTLERADALFRYEVTKTGVLLFGDALDYEEFKAYAYRVFTDSRDLRALELILLKKSIRSLAKRYALDKLRQ
ncbi:MAG: hypothetical protein A3G49_00815 [Candidatus Sungbacteria bacterium RIFCSPLOWO2_12_FULL_41_11]|uniref:Polymerase beta nucleotidyltransferase domain-containing protein n=1 Tax=Candidatus Sungbacteria bacterium RIFCSPLOWO2_12_FULL_41_11 TaxID=1802286 RepID=A0A1G2LPM8_9BACT|nr:MAG: hypothetical protein A3G49_00815 [Candidatus Sungbacteria bacterium RIFCSPLOWO2_12_FULL_41_11]